MDFCLQLSCRLFPTEHPLPDQRIIQPAVALALVSRRRAGHHPALVGGYHHHGRFPFAQHPRIGVFLQKGEIFAEVSGKAVHFRFGGDADSGRQQGHHQQATAIPHSPHDGTGLLPQPSPRCQDLLFKCQMAFLSRNQKRPLREKLSPSSRMWPRWEDRGSAFGFGSGSSIADLCRHHHAGRGN